MQQIESSSGIRPHHDREAALLERVKQTARRRSLMIWLARAAIVVAFFAVWQIASIKAGTFWVASPVSVGERAWAMLLDGSLEKNFYVTTIELLTGLAIGSIIGMLTGVLLARNPQWSVTLDPFIALTFAVPHLALGPLIIMYLGIGLKSKIVLVAVTAFFYMFYNTFAGVKAVNPELIHVSQIMGANPWTLTTKVLLPAALLWLFSGLRFAIRQALAAAVIGEYIASSAGLGWLINSSSGTFDTVGVFVGIICITIVAGVLYAIAGLIEKRALRWQIT